MYLSRKFEISDVPIPMSITALLKIIVLVLCNQSYKKQAFQNWPWAETLPLGRLRQGSWAPESVDSHWVTAGAGKPLGQRLTMAQCAVGAEACIAASGTLKNRKMGPGAMRIP